MAQFTKFNFFNDIELSLDQKNMVSSLQPLDITCCTHGGGNIFIGDSEGGITIVNRDFRVARYPDFQGCVSHIRYLRQKQLLIAIGDSVDIRSDEDRQISLKSAQIYRDKINQSTPEICKSLNLLPKINQMSVQAAEIKIYDINKFDSTKTLRQSIKLNPGEIITTFDVSEYANFIIIGLKNGKLIYFRGDLFRYGMKPLYLDHPTNTEIQFVGITGQQNVLNVYVATSSSISTYSFDISSKQPPIYKELEKEYSVSRNLTTLNNESNLIVADNEKFQYFTNESMAQCVAMKSQKARIYYTKTHIIYSDINDKNIYNVTCFDPVNQFISFTNSFPKVHITNFVEENDLLYIFTLENKVYLYKEKDIHEKLSSLYNNKLYEKAISLAISNNYEESKIKEIYKQYGDSLYERGNYENSIEVYCKTIPAIEPSSIIQKFLDSQKIKYLVIYLEALHSQNIANSDHTTLLLNCYTKLRANEKITTFVNDKNLNYDIVTAIDVLISSSYYNEAIQLCDLNKNHDYYLKILIEHIKDFEKALHYVKKLDKTLQEKYMKIYGSFFIEKIPNESTEMLGDLCTSNDSCKPEDFLTCYVGQKEYLKKFLDHVTKHIELCGHEIWNTLLELTLDQHNQNSHKEVMNILTNPKANYDQNISILLVQLNNFKEGQIYLYKHYHMTDLELQYYIDNKLYDDIMMMLFDRQRDYNPTIWMKVLNEFINSSNPPINYLDKLLEEIDKKKLFPPLQILKILEQSKYVPFNTVRKYIMNTIKFEKNIYHSNSKQIIVFKEKIRNMKNKMSDIETKNRIYQIPKCHFCSNQLDFPSIHFICGHTYHQRCLGDNDHECPNCSQDYKIIIERRKELIDGGNITMDNLNYKLENDKDGFSEITSFFSRGLFSEFPNGDPEFSHSTKENKSDSYIEPINDLAVDNVQDVADVKDEEDEGNPFDDDDAQSPNFNTEEDINPFSTHPTKTSTQHKPQPGTSTNQQS